MAVVQKFGKPDLFITFTCNSNWPEVTQSLYRNQTYNDRPDLVARVFKLKLDALLHDLKKSNIFGRVIASIHVIEFQKRGLPHAHILIILADEDKIRDNEVIDDIIRAEFPDQTTEPELYAIVCNTMVHGPCGKNYPNSPCMKDGKCSKEFPKAYRDDTNANIDGFPLYKRRNNGAGVAKEIEKRKVWVI